MRRIFSQIFDQFLQIFQCNGINRNIQQNSIIQIGIGQNHSVQNRPAEIRVLQNRIGKHGTAQIGTGKISIAQIGTGKIDAFQVCYRKIGIFKIFIGKFAVFKILAAEFYPVRHKIIRSQRRGIRRTVPMSHRTPGKPCISAFILVPFRHFAADGIIGTLLFCRFFSVRRTSVKIILFVLSHLTAPAP